MWVDVQQNTPEWFDLRKGRITSSKFEVVMANSFNSKGEFNPKLAFGVPAVKYSQALALERITGKIREDKFTNSFMDDGHIYEPVARKLYEFENICRVTNGGFNHIGWVGDSPDGNVDNGCVEIKSVISDTQWERIKKGGYDLSYKWQIQGHLWLGNKDWCDFVSYCHSNEFIDEKRLYVFRVYRDETMIHNLIQRINYFNNLIQENINIITKN